MHYKISPIEIIFEDKWMQRLWLWADENGIPPAQYTADGKYFEGLPRNKKELLELKFLNLSENNLKELPPEIGSLKNLETLMINNNLLTVLPPEIGKLENLKYLILHGNQITFLPPEMGKLASLKIMSASYNKLSALPKEIGALENLEILKINSNQITALPVEIGLLANTINHSNIKNHKLISKNYDYFINYNIPDINHIIDILNDCIIRGTHERL
jgi:Leucine-rich repeat (LRR) protein